MHIIFDHAYVLQWMQFWYLNNYYSVCKILCKEAFRKSTARQNHFGMKNADVYKLLSMQNILFSFALSTHIVDGFLQCVPCVAHPR